MAHESREEANRDRQPTLGEVTLEYFLSLSGFMAKPSSKVGPESRVAPAAETPLLENTLPHVQCMHFQLPSVPWQQNVLPLFMSANHVAQPPLSVVSAAAPFLDTGFTDAQIALRPSSLLGTVSDMRTPGHKRIASRGVVIEKTVERRQKGMIKNRESAARSRARKPAYTQELENKVTFLEEENARLRKQREIMHCLQLQSQRRSSVEQAQHLHLFDSDVANIGITALSNVLFVIRIKF